MEIITTPNTALLQKTQEIKKVDNKILKIISDMIEVLNNTHDPEGVGLAAPQVGLPLRLFLAKPTAKSKILVFINPMILEVNEEEAKMKKRILEGCLSLPSIWGRVIRKREITLSYLDGKGKPRVKKFKGFLSTIIQHEMDHLEGVLFTKKVMEQNQKLYKSYKNAEGEDEFEEIKV